MKKLLSSCNSNDAWQATLNGNGALKRLEKRQYPNKLVKNDAVTPKHWEKKMHAQPGC